MFRRSLLQVITFILALHTVMVLADGKNSPNFLVFMIDDLDSALFERMLDDGTLPNIEKHLVKRGIKFNNFYATDAICCPSRTTFFTGQYVQNHGVTNVTQGYELIYPTDNTGQNGDKTFLQKWLKQKNYTTGLIGKYLNAYAAIPAKPDGWDYWVALYSHNSYKMRGYTYIDNDGSKPDPELENQQFQTDFIAEKGVSFLKNELQDDKPFFLYMAPTAPHTNMPYQPGEDGRRVSYQLAYAATLEEYPDFPLAWSPNLKRGPDFFNTNGKSSWITDNIQTEHIELYYRGLNNYYKSRYSNMRGIDKMVGSVIKALKDSGRYDDTTLIFVSDNGFFLGEYGLTQKGAPYEAAINVPLVIAGPSIALNNQGHISDALVLNNDLAVTIADLAQVKPLRDVDGQSMTALLTQTPKTNFRNQFLVRFYQEETGLDPLDIIPNYQAIRTVNSAENSLYVNYGNTHHIITTDQNGETQLLETKTERDQLEFYNIDADPQQLNNQFNELNLINKITREIQLEQFSNCQGTQCQALETQ